MAMLNKFFGGVNNYMSPTRALTSSSSSGYSTGVSAPELAAQQDIEVTKLYETICDNPNLTYFKQLIDTVGLAHFTDCLGPHTIFAPTNCAFKDLTLGTAKRAAKTFYLEGEDVSLEYLSHILRNHIVGGLFPAKTLAGHPTLGVESGHTLGVFPYTGNTYVNVTGRDFRKAAKIVECDIYACDGVIHLIDEVLLDPPCHQFIKTDVYTIIASSPCHTILTAAINKLGLCETLKDCSKRYTIFAPNDAAFRCIPAAALEAVLACPDKLKAVLLAHVTLDEHLTRRMNDRDIYPTLDCRSVQIRFCNYGLCNEEIYVVGDGADTKNYHTIPVIVRRDLLAENGVVHSIDKVISVTKLNIIEKLCKAGNFTMLLSAIKAAGLEETLADNTHKFTLFAPTDEAFGVLGMFPEFVAKLMAVPAALKEVLLHHVVDGRWMSEDLPIEQPIPTLGHRNLVLHDEDGKRLHVKLEGSTAHHTHVHCVDEIASNGVIHTIDHVLLMFDLVAVKIHVCVHELPHGHCGRCWKEPVIRHHYRSRSPPPARCGPVGCGRSAPIKPACTPCAKPKLAVISCNPCAKPPQGCDRSSSVVLRSSSAAASAPCPKPCDPPAPKPACGPCARPVSPPPPKRACDIPKPACGPCAKPAIPKPASCNPCNKPAPAPCAPKVGCNLHRTPLSSCNRCVAPASPRMARDIVVEAYDDHGHDTVVVYEQEYDGYKALVHQHQGTGEFIYMVDGKPVSKDEFDALIVI